jgi:copper homeostasis protein
MEQDILYAKAGGCAGVVFGILLDNRSVDIARTKHLAALASPMEVTFHRAIDEARDLSEALEDAIAAGAGRVLTSGGHVEAAAGASKIAELVRRAAGRVHIAIGGGVDSKNVVQLLRQTGATHVHASLRVRVDNPHPTHGSGYETVDDSQPFAVTAQAVRDFAEALRSVTPLVANSR